MKSNFPLARRAELVVQIMDDETIVYDSTHAQANLLNHTAAVVWGLCDGKTSVSEIAVRAGRALNAPVDEPLVWYTLGQLSGKNLLQERAALPVAFARLTRRDFLRAGVVSAAVVLPVIVTVAAPTVSQAASCLQSGQSCDFGTDCCSELCVQGSCA